MIVIRNAVCTLVLLAAAAGLAAAEEATEELPVQYTEAVLRVEGMI